MKVVRVELDPQSELIINDNAIHSMFVIDLTSFLKVFLYGFSVVVEWGMTSNVTSIHLSIAILCDRFTCNFHKIFGFIRNAVLC